MSQLPPRQYLYETKDVAAACASQDKGPAECPPTLSLAYPGAKVVSDEAINVAPWVNSETQPMIFNVLGAVFN